MPVSSHSVGAACAPLPADVDARWTMAYACAVGDELPCYLDTTRPEPVLAHPVFPVCFEWPAFLATHGLEENGALGADERRRGVHATHDLVLHRPLRAGERLTTRASIAGVEARRPGAYQVVRLETTDAAGGPVCTTWYGSLYRGVAVDGPDRPARVPAAPAPPAPSETEPVRLPVSPGAAHVYTECSRIWNPIHTDAAVARRAGLPGIILHGTATLALAVSQVVRRACGGDPARIARVGARFAAMVRVGTEIEVRVGETALDAAGTALAFEVRNAEGEVALRDGFAVLREA